MTVTVGAIVTLNSTGRCSHCDGIVENTPSRQGCSLARLVAVHEESCPGTPRRKTKTTTDTEESS